MQQHSSGLNYNGKANDNQQMVVFPFIQVNIFPSLAQLIRNILLVIIGASACFLLQERGVLFPTSSEKLQVANRVIIATSNSDPETSWKHDSDSIVGAFEVLDKTFPSSLPPPFKQSSWGQQEAPKEEEDRSNAVPLITANEFSSSPATFSEHDQQSNALRLTGTDDKEESIQEERALVFPKSAFRQFASSKTVRLCPFTFSHGDGGGNDKTKEDSFPCRECSPRKGLPNVMARLQQKQPIKICYFGGSVTAGKNYREIATNTLQDMYPDSHWIEKNAGVRATGSDLGACRLHHDVLPFEPDLLVIEFAINDDGEHKVDNKYELCQQSMENIVRTFWSHLPKSDILFLYTIREQEMEFYEKGTFSPAASVHEDIARHYNIPSVHVGLEIAMMAMEGTVAWHDGLPQTPEDYAALKGKFIFGKDGVHPHPSTGGEKYVEAIERCFRTIESVNTKTSPSEAAYLHQLPLPISPDNAGGMAMALPDSEFVILSPTVQPLASGDPIMSIINTNYPMTPSKYVARLPGDTFTISFQGTAIGLYALVGPMSGDLVVTLDDGKPQTVTVFTSFCSMTRPGYFPLATNLTEGTHKIVLDVSPEVPEKDKILKARTSPFIEGTKQATTYVFGAFCIRGGQGEARVLPSV